MVKTEQIKTKEDIVKILNSLKPYEKAISRMVEDSIEYELACERVQEYLLEIEKALIGKEEINMNNIANADLRMFAYWNYLKEEITLEELFLEIRNCSNKTLINID